MKLGWGGRVTLAAIGACLVAIAVEILASHVVFSAGSSITGNVFVAGAYATYLFFTAALGFWGTVLFERCVSKWGDRWALVIAIAFVAPLVGYVGYLLGIELSAGGWIKQQSWVWSVKYVVALGFVFASAIGLATIVFVSKRSRKIRVGFGILVSAITVAILAFALLKHVGSYTTVFTIAVCTATSLLWVGLCAILINDGAHPSRYRWGIVLAVVALICAFVTMSLKPRAFGEVVRRSTTIGIVGQTFFPGSSDLGIESVLKFPPTALERDPEFTQSPEHPDFNILLITVDTLRADVIKPWRKDQSYITDDDAPNLDRWMQEAVAFEYAYAQSSATRKSMPAMFRSVEVNEPFGTFGESISSRFRDRGPTFAVVNDYFFEPRSKHTVAMLRGFDSVSPYDKSDQNALVPLLNRELKQKRSEPFLGWVHFYNMHEPGFDGVKQKQKGNPLKKRYRRSLRWLDKQMSMIFDTLKETGLDKSTIVVFAADHGEGLGDNNSPNHQHLWEEEIRVPLAIKVPGVEPRVVKQTVGNIDVIPTLYDLIGRAPEASFRGRSLVKSFTGEALKERPYFAIDFWSKKAALIRERQKLVYHYKLGVFHRYDLAADPTEDLDLFLESDTDLRLVRDMVLHEEKLLDEEQRKALWAIESKREEIRPLTIALARDKAALKEIHAKWKRLEREEQDAIYFQLCHRDKALNKLMIERLKRDSETQRMAFLSKVPGQGCSQWKLSEVAALMKRATKGELEAWLNVTKSWKRKSGNNYVKQLEALVDGGNAELSERATLLLLQNIQTIKSTKPSQILTAWVREQWESPETAVVSEALLASAALKDKEVVPKALELSRQKEKFRLRQVAVTVLGKLGGKAVIPDIIEVGNDPFYALHVVKVLTRMNAKEGLPFIEQVAKKHPNGIVRSMAKNSAKKVRKNGK